MLDGVNIHGQCLVLLVYMSEIGGQCLVAVLKVNDLALHGVVRDNQIVVVDSASVKLSVEVCNSGIQVRNLIGKGKITLLQ